MTYAMALCYLILLCLFVPFLPIYVQSKISEKMHAPTPLESPETANISHKGHSLTHHPDQRHFLNVYGILILIGWGTLLPIGALIARYLRKFPVTCDVWFKGHMVCQTLGYVLGTAGWCVGPLFGKSSKHFVSKTQSTLSIIAFTFITVQTLAMLIRPNKDAGYCNCWNIWHHVLGYAIIGIVTANIFVGLHNQSQAETLKRVYAGILGALAIVVVPMEIIRCNSLIMHQVVWLNSNMFSYSP